MGPVALNPNLAVESPEIESPEIADPGTALNQNLLNSQSPVALAVVPAAV